MTSLRIRLFSIFAAMITLALAFVFVVISKNFSEINREFETDALGAHARVIGELWESTGGCLGKTSSLSFRNLDNVFFEETGFAFKIICDGGLRIIESDGFPNLELPQESIAFLYDNDEKLGWLVAKKTVDEGAIYAALVGDPDYKSHFISNAFGVSLILLFLFCCLFLAYFFIGKTLRPIAGLAKWTEERTQPSKSFDLPAELNPLQLAIGKLKESEHRTKTKNSYLLSNERRFTANAAHELLTPLAAIKTEVQLQERHTADKSLKNWLLELGQRVDRATHTVDQLITLARLEPGTRPVKTSNINVNYIVDDILENLDEKIKLKKLDVNTLRSEVTAWGSPTLIITLMRNLLNNAVQYTPEGGTITITSSLSGDGREICVSNECKELPEYLTTHIFDRFVRGPHESETGSGLGLAIAQKIAEAHDASIDVDVAENRKSISFSVRGLSSTSVPELSSAPN